jgi:hypothetical protein
MPFPYAYYKEEYTGPLHGTDLEAPLLVLNKTKSFTSADVVGGVLDVTGKTVLSASTSLGDITIDGFSGGKEGQLLLIRKENQLNTLTIRFGVPIPGQVLVSNISNIVLGNGRYGAAIFLKGASSWHHIDNIGYFGSGSALNPAISFGEDTDTGIFRAGANTLSLATAGIERLKISSTLATSALPVLLPAGSATVPAIGFSGDSTTGIFKSTNSIDLSANGAPVLQFNKDGSITMLTNPSILSDFAYQFSTSNTSVPQAVRAGSLLASDLFTDSIQVPLNGIYSKGHIKSSGQLQGVATSAQFADLAERYESDASYPAGTIVSIGGTKEISIACDPSKLFGIISSEPGFKMNSDAGTDETHPYVALAGRVPCRVIGSVHKGDSISLSEIPGVGHASSGTHSIGRALEDSLELKEKLVLVVTRAVI